MPQGLINIDLNVEQYIIENILHMWKGISLEAFGKTFVSL